MNDKLIRNFEKSYYSITPKKIYNFYLSLVQDLFKKKIFN